MTEILGIDIGGSGMKAAVVDVGTGEIISEKHRIETPKPATPEAMGDVMQDISNWIPLTHVMRSIQEPWLAFGSPTNHYVVVAIVGAVAAAIALRASAQTES